MSEIKDKVHYDESNDTLTIQRSDDVTDTADHVARLRHSTPEHGAYMNSKFVHAAKIPTIIIEQMANGQCCGDGIKYNLFSPDPEEQRRALMHVQSYHSEWLAIRGKPFAKNRVKWA